MLAQAVVRCFGKKAIIVNQDTNDQSACLERLSKYHAAPSKNHEHSGNFLRNPVILKVLAERLHAICVLPMQDQT